MSSKSEHLLRKYDVISISQDVSRSILLPVSYLLISLPSEGQYISTNQISSTYLYSRLRYNNFRFWKTNDRHIGILLPVSIIDHFAVIGALFCIIGLSNFIQIESSTAEISNQISNIKSIFKMLLWYLIMSYP